MSNRINNVKLGADPEFFIKDVATNEVVSAEGLIGGTKDQPKQISEVGHYIQEDNVMAEFNIPPAIDSESFSKDIQFVIDHINLEVLPPNLVNSTKASNEMRDEDVQSEQSKMFACDPDLNVWLRCQNQGPARGGNLRTCGGHIHVGYDNPELETSEQIIKAMDLFLGVPSIIMDLDKRRREMYGKAGAFRIKDYGCEYRTLSNFWIFTDELRTWAYENTMKAIEFVNNGFTISEKIGNQIVECINNQDVDLALSLISNFNVNVIKQKQKENVKY